MKLKMIKKGAIALLSGCLATVMALPLSIMQLSVYAATEPSVTVRGAASTGFTVVGVGQTELINVNGMYPGESAESVLRIENADTDAFTVTMSVKNIAQTTVNLAEVTNLTITNMKTSEVLFTGPLSDAKEDQLLNLGRFEPNTVATNATDLAFNLTLDGGKTTNAYQKAVAEFSITLNAESLGTPPTETPTPTPTPSEEEDGGGGGGGGRFLTPSTFVGTTIPTTTIPITTTPLGTIEFATPEDLVELLDKEPIPLGVVLPKEMPKTGEISLLVYTLIGMVIILAGVFLLQPFKTFGKKAIPSRKNRNFSKH